MFTIESATKNYPSIPQTTIVNLYNYVNHGTPGGHFLTAVLSGDLFEAVNRADTNNQKALTDLVKLIYNDVPWTAVGSKEKVSAWIEKGGLGEVA